MRKKFFLFIIAAFMATSSAWADEDAFSNFVFNANTGQLSFYDSFQVGHRFNKRSYSVDISTEYEEEYVSNSGKFYKHWPTLAYVTEYIPNGEGGDIVINIKKELNKAIDSCYAKGYTKLNIHVSGKYWDEIMFQQWYRYTLPGTHEPDYEYQLPSVQTYVLAGRSLYYYYEDTPDVVHLSAYVQGFNKVTYTWQESTDGGNTWYSAANYAKNGLDASPDYGGYLSTKDARQGQYVDYTCSFNKFGKQESLFRLKVTDSKTNEIFMTDAFQVSFVYPWQINGGTKYWGKKGEELTIQKPQDCKTYRYNSANPVSVKEKAGVPDYLFITMPGNPLKIEEVTTTYTVKFLNADYTLLKAVEVECGADATAEAPANPTYSTYTFTGWSQDFTNVHKNMSVLAKYDIGNTYWFDAYMSNHDNVVYPAEGFTQNLTRAMVGDQLTFTADVFAATNATIAYETALWDNNAQDYLWQKNGHITVAEYTTPNKEQFFDQTINVCYYPNNSYINPFQRKMAVRFIMFIAGQTIYSDPWEIDIYYPLFINAPEMDALFVENTAGDFNMGEQEIFIPAGYNDTVRLYSINGADGGCFSFGRLLYPDRRVENGVDEEGNAFIIGLGELDTISINVSEKLVVFDGVYGNGYPQQLDFTAEGFAKLNGYYGEVVPCGGSVTMPEDPTQENAIFLGWKAWSSDYADDAYLHVPSVEDKIIGFTAQWEDLPEVPQYKVRFYGKDGTPLLLDTLINEGENAVPPVAPEVSGYHFVGWDKPYTTITADVDITALYGEDNKTWTVTYWNCANPWPTSYSTIGTEQVNDGEAAPQQIIPVAGEEGYTFAFWATTSTDNGTTIKDSDVEADLSHVTGNIDVYARWKKSEYTITYTMDGADIFSELVEHGEMPTAYQAIEDQGKPATEQYVYTFDHWNPAIVAATSDATYEAVFKESARKYLVRFQNWDHTLLDEQQVEYGKSAVAPADPTREGYTFKGWDREFNNIIADMTVTAVFEKNKDDKDTGIKDVQILPSEGVQKILHEGRLYIILPDGKVFNAQGVRVK